MNIPLAKAIVASIPAIAVLGWSVTAFFHNRTVGTVLQVLGSACLLLVVLTHIAEAVHLVPMMGWGEPHSAGHYLDLSSAILGITLLPLGIALRARKPRS